LAEPFKLDVIWLAPVCLLGFAACPYLDLTFHRARQQSCSPRASFGVGFGGLFLLMILFTVLYSGAHLGTTIPTPLKIMFFVHWAGQTAFTLAAHARELQHGGERAVTVAVALAAASWIGYVVLQGMPIHSRMEVSELIYRVFMGFYGLVFPAYVWLVMRPTSHGFSRVSKRNLIVYAITVLVAMPMFGVGFLMFELIWLVPGVTIVLVARLATRAAPHPDYATSPAL
jgi:hypothetical protein